MRVLLSSKSNDHRRVLRFWVLAGLALGLLLATPQRSLAQEFRGTLTGQVTDPSGAVIANAKVTATNAETGSIYSETSSDTGVYYIPYVVPGTYTVKAEADGFKVAIQDKV